MSEGTPSNIYAAPDARAATPAGKPRDWRPFRTRAYLLLVGGIGVFVLTIGVVDKGLLSGTPLKVVASLACGAGTLCFVLAAICALVALFRGNVRIPGWESVLLAMGPLLAGGTLAFYGFVLTLWATSGFARGRQLRRFGRVLLPQVKSGEDWASESDAIEVPDELRRDLAHRWRWNGQTEHASVAAFARLTLDLIALGAPPSLIHASNRDAEDEVRHAELCFALARAIDGRSESPGAFPEVQRVRTLPWDRTFALAALAVNSLVDGALHEGLSARVIARLARRCTVTRIREALLEIAADEGRHAAHGWRVVEWCLAAGGEPVAEALRGAVGALPERIRSELPQQARSGAWEPYGIHGAELEDDEHARARAEIVRRVAEMTGMRAAA